MKKYKYENATVYITIPNEEQIKNIHKVTEKFAAILVKKGLIRNDVKRKNSRRVSVVDTDARGRNKGVKRNSNTH